MYSICSIAPTISRLMGLKPPADSDSDVIEEVIDRGRDLGIDRVTRCLIFTPDAIGSDLVRKHGPLFLPVVRHAPLKIQLRSVFPPKTPVCYASMFTGTLPDVHGIREYVKRPPEADTLFDVITRAGGRAAIVAVKDSSLDTIFRRTGAEHFSETGGRAVTERAVALSEADRHNLIVAYQQEYDDTVHGGHPESEEGLAAVRRHIADFGSIAAALKKNWNRRPYLVAFAPDHGAHFDPTLGTGAHGEDIPEDMGVTHFFGLE
jgi:hypothetical protein